MGNVLRKQHQLGAVGLQWFTNKTRLHRRQVIDGLNYMNIEYDVNIADKPAILSDGATQFWPMCIPEHLPIHLLELWSLKTLRPRQSDPWGWDRGNTDLVNHFWTILDHWDSLGVDQGQKSSCIKVPGINQFSAHWGGLFSVFRVWCGVHDAYNVKTRPLETTKSSNALRLCSHIWIRECDWANWEAGCPHIGQQADKGTCRQSTAFQKGCSNQADYKPSQYPCITLYILALAVHAKKTVAGNFA